MTVLSKLFGGGDTPKAVPPPPPPKIGDAAQASVARAEGARLRRRRGYEDSMLGSSTGTGRVMHKTLGGA